MLALLGAMREEVSGLKRQMVIKEVLAPNDCRIYKGKYRKQEVLLVETGLGKERAETAGEFALEHYPVSAIVSLGFAGALTSKVAVGDIILCARLCCSQETPLGAGYSDAGLLSVATQALRGKKLCFQQGNSVTVVTPISEPKQRQTLGGAFKAEVADMEAYWLARLAQSRRIPFLGVRAISDTLEDNLSPIGRYLGSNHWRRQVVFYFLSHPHRLGSLFRLYKNARRARESLTGFVEAFVDRLGDG